MSWPNFLPKDIFKHSKNSLYSCMMHPETQTKITDIFILSEVRLI